MFGSQVDTNNGNLFSTLHVPLSMFRNIKRSFSRHLIYQLPFAYTTFDASTMHIVSRHPHPIGVTGLFGPFTQSVWLVFLLMRSISLVITFITIQNIKIKFLGGKFHYISKELVLSMVYL